MHEFARIALIGTAKSGNELPTSGPHPAQALLNADLSANVEETLLLRAGVDAIVRQAGRKGTPNLAAVAPAPPESRSSGSEKLLGILQNAFATDHRELLSEFLQQMESNQLVLPMELLPQALSVADARLRELLLPVLGTRGAWLSEFRHEWSWVRAGVAMLTSSDLEILKQEWEIGGVSERCRALATVRRSDPALGINWLRESFSREKADHRVRLLAELKQGLEEADEEFLESCLTDRSSQVIDVAAGLLARLPGSALSARMRARGEQLLVGEMQGLIRRRLKLTCAPPESIDKEWQRDGVSSKPPQGQGKRAFWAETVIAAIPPPFWLEKFQTTPEALLQAIAEDPFENTVIAGWTKSLINFSEARGANVNWATALCDWWSGKAERLEGQGRAEAINHLTAILPILPKIQAEDAVTKLLDSGVDSAAIPLLLILPRPWSLKLAQHYLQRARNVLNSTDDNRAWQWVNSLTSAARSIPREAFAAALLPWEFTDSARVPTTQKSLLRETGHFCEMIRLREAFYREIPN